jgi:hypothetical protein
MMGRCQISSAAEFKGNKDKSWTSRMMDEESRRPAVHRQELCRNESRDGTPSQPRSPESRERGKRVRRSPADTKNVDAAQEIPLRSRGTQPEPGRGETFLRSIGQGIGT